MGFDSDVVESTRIGRARRGDTSDASMLPDAFQSIFVGQTGKVRIDRKSENRVLSADPGNLMRTNDGKLGYLDFGMMANIDTKIRQ